mgnify:FL=1
MYGLPKDFDTSCLIGCLLERVSFTKNQVIFDFDRDTSIVVEGPFKHSIGKENNQENIKEPPIQNSSTMNLLGCEVFDTKSNDDGTLCLMFDNGQSLTCYDDSPNFESYQIQIGKKTIIV